jgi:type I restriction enzyme S subunit
VPTLSGARVAWFGELIRVMNLRQYSISAAQPGLGIEMIAQLRVPVPPIEEQAMIAE